MGSVLHGNLHLARAKVPCLEVLDRCAVDLGSLVEYGVESDLRLLQTTTRASRLLRLTAALHQRQAMVALTSTCLWILCLLLRPREFESCFFLAAALFSPNFSPSWDDFNELAPYSFPISRWMKLQVSVQPADWSS